MRGISEIPPKQRHAGNLQDSSKKLHEGISEIPPKQRHAGNL
jgi:hypothetical protein